MRTRLVILLACALSCALLVPFAVPPIACADVPLRGTALHSLWWSSSDGDMDRELDLSREAGASVVRLDVVWGSLELAGKGRWSADYVARLDRFVEGAEARGMKVIATLWSTPCWASSAPDSRKRDCSGAWWDRGVGLYPPHRAGDYADAAEFVAARYGARLAALEIWNEPNLEAPHGETWTTGDKAGDYVDLLRATYPKVKRVAPDVAVLAGSTSMADREFVDELYAEGMAGLQDGIAVHPYNEWRAPEDRWKPEYREYTLLPGLEWVREAQVAAGEGAKGLWITEFGWSSARGPSWGVSEQQQADYLGRAFALLDGLDYVKAAVVYNLRAKGTDQTDREAGFGLVRRNFTPKPAYAAVKAALTGSGGRPLAAAPAPDGRRAEDGLGGPVAVKLVERSGSLVATATTEPGRVVLLDARRCSSVPRKRVRVKASRSGRIARRVGRAPRGRCRVLGRLVRAKR